MRIRGSAVLRKTLALLVLLGSASISYLAVITWRFADAPIEARIYGGDTGALASDGPSPSNPFASATGTHLIAFVLTASDCGWSQHPTGMAVVGNLRDRIRSAHGNSYAQVSVVGVALDRDLGAGVRFLSDIGHGELERAFDQIMVGGSWLNEQVVRFAWREGVARAMTPSVILIERSVNSEAYPSTYTIDVEADRFLGNLQGTVQIVAWMNEGMPLDAFRKGSAAAK